MEGEIKVVFVTLSTFPKTNVGGPWPLSPTHFHCCLSGEPAGQRCSPQWVLAQMRFARSVFFFAYV